MTRPERPTRSAWMLRVLGRRARRKQPKPLSQINEQLAEAMSEVSCSLPRDLYAWIVIVNYIAVAQRVLEKSPPELIRDCAIATEAQTLMPE